MTLIELLVAMAIIVVILGLGTVNLNSGRASADSHALAILVSEQLRDARQSAIATQQPVAVLFPSNHAGSPLSQSLYWATGVSKAHVSKVVDFSAENAGGVLFAGLWSVSTGTFSTYPALGGQRNSSFNVPQWLATAPLQQDYALIFTPDGGVVSDGLPYYQDGYYLVASAGAGAVSSTSAPTSATPGSPTPAIGYFKAGIFGNPWGIKITSNGEVSIASGLVNADNSVVILPGVPVLTGTMPTAPAISALPAISPQTLPIGGLYFFPPATTPATSGVNVTLQPGQRISLATNVTDTSGRDLYVSWTATQVSGTSGVGAFSFPATRDERMDWDAVHQVWTSSWDWMCPPGAASGDSWQFSCQFGDGTGAHVAAPYANPVAQIGGTEKVYTSFYDFTAVGRWGVLYANLDGSSPTILESSTVSGGATGLGVDLSVSTDGSTVVLGYDYVQPDNAPISYAAFSGVTGQPLGAPVTPSGLLGDVRISPHGDKVAYTKISSHQLPSSAPNYAVYVNSLDGSHEVGPIHTDPSSNVFPTQATFPLEFSPDETKFTFFTNSPGLHVGTVWIADLTASPPTVIDTQIPSAFATWTPDSQSLFLRPWPGTNPLFPTEDLYKYTLGNPVPTQITTGGTCTYGQSMQLSPLNALNLYGAQMSNDVTRMSITGGALIRLSNGMRLPTGWGQLGTNNIVSRPQVDLP